MIATVKKSRLSGVSVAPPSKSMAHRLLICAALSGGKCRVENLAMSDDIKATIACLKALGADITDGNVDGSALFTRADTLDCNESGSTLRFMIPLCLMAGRDITLVGSERLFARSLDIYRDICRKNGFRFETTKNSVTVNGRLKAGVYTIRGDVSSQFISGLLYVLPLLDGDSVIEITGRLESAPYIDMTLAAQRIYGIDIVRDGQRIEIKGNRRYMPRDMTVEGDCSNAAFFEALRVLGHNVRVTGLDPDTLQGDYVFFEHFERIKESNTTVDVSDCPDLAPILMAVAAANHGVTLVGTARLKIKESDRGQAMASELKKLGVDVTLYDNKIEVGCGIKPPCDMLHGHNDHRIVMSMAVLLTLVGGSIDDAQAVSKSLPDFFERITALGAEVSYEAE